MMTHTRASPLYACEAGTYGARVARPRILLVVLIVILVLLAWARPVDHDESQYVAAVQLSSRGFLPYRDFAYFQAPLQPLLFAPLGAFGSWLWPVMRIVNALLGAGAVACVYLAARRGGAAERPALIGAALFAGTDILLFAVGVARNDALPAFCLAAALLPIVRGELGQATRESALLAGLLLSAAAAAKISYALPAAAYGVWALVDRRHRPAAVLAGAVPMIVLVGWTWWQAPANFVFDVLAFPAWAPGQYFDDTGRGWKLTIQWRLIDALKFLSLGAAAPALAIVAADRWRARQFQAIDVLLVAGLVAALLPEPTWRQYLLPLLPPLFARLAAIWSERPPGRIAIGIAAIFAAAGVVPSAAVLAEGTDGLPMSDAIRQGDALRQAMDAAKVPGPIASLSPQILPATGRLPDVRFAPGPFYFRSHGLLSRDREVAAALVSQPMLEQAMTIRPSAVITGGEGGWSSGSDALDAVLDRWAIDHDYRRVAVAGGRFRLYIAPR